MTLCNVSGKRMLHNAMGHVKGFDSSSIELLLSIACAICMWQLLSVTVANFLLHSAFRQVKPCSRVLSSLGLTLSKLVISHVSDGFLIHSSAAATVLNISTASVRSRCFQVFC